jgi:hypothetical protein
MLLQRWAVEIVVAVIIIGGGYAIGQWLKEQGRAEIRPEVTRLKNELAAERANRARADSAAAAYRSEMDAIRSRPVSRAPVRLCRDPDPVPATSTTALGTHGATATTWGFNGTAGSDLEAGPDIGPDLYGLAAQCDAEIAKLRALQGWVNDIR